MSQNYAGNTCLECGTSSLSARPEENKRAPQLTFDTVSNSLLTISFTVSTKEQYLVSGA